MKKILLNFLGCASLALGAMNANAQLADGSTAPDWTLTDINGNTYNLYTILNSGKTVFLDFSATWCGPCWNYHNSGALEELYNAHGPTGTCSNDVMVFYIESESANNTACLYGPTGCTGPNGGTQGDWVTGTPYPIIDAGSNSVVSNYAIAYFPTIYKICTDKKIYEVGQANAQALENSVSGCGFTTDASVSAGPSPLECNTTFSPSFTLKNSGSTTMTAADIDWDIDGGTPATYNWTGSLAAGATTTVTLPSQTLTAGSHDLNLNITSANGGADGNNVNNCITYSFNVNTATAVAAPLTESFGSTAFPYTDWILDNPDGSLTWQRVSTNSGSVRVNCYSYGTVGAKDAFIIKPIDLSAYSNAALSFDVAHRQYSASYSDQLKVYVSADCGATWTTVYNKSGASLATNPTPTTSSYTPVTADWRNEALDISAFAGQSKVFVKFELTNGYGNNVYVDNINIANNVTVPELESNASVSVYPNPNNGNFTLDVTTVNAENVKIEVLNSMGQIVYTASPGTVKGQNVYSMNLEGLQNGLYLVNVYTGKSVTTERITVLK